MSDTPTPATVDLEMPTWMLLQIAVCGKMGDGELCESMRLWAIRECEGHGLKEVLSRNRAEHLVKMRKRIHNIVGSEGLAKMDGAIDDVMDKLKGAR